MSLRFRTVLDSIPVYRPGGCPEERGAETAIKLSSNECPWEPPSSVVDAVSQAAHSLNRYPDFYKVGTAEALAAHYGCDAGRIAIDNGSGTLLQDLVRIVADQGDRVIFGTPSFAAYEIDVLLAGAVPVKVPLDDAYIYDLDTISKAVDERTRMVLICNPNNPTGTFLSTVQLRDFLKRTPSDILVVIDEAYHEFVTCEDQEASLGLLDEFDNVVLLRTFSKAFGLAGMRIGYCLAAPETVDALNKTVAEFSVSIPAQAAACACLEPETLAVIEERVAEIIQNRTDFEEALEEAGIDYLPSQSNFVMLPQESQAGFDRMAAGGVICRPFAEPEGIRITIGTHADMARVAAALELSWPRP